MQFCGVPTSVDLIAHSFLFERFSVYRSDRAPTASSQCSHPNSFLRCSSSAILTIKAPEQEVLLLLLGIPDGACALGNPDAIGTANRPEPSYEGLDYQSAWGFLLVSFFGNSRRRVVS